MRSKNLETDNLYNLLSITEAELLTVESAAFAYSVFRGWGYRSHYPIAVIVDNLESADEIAKSLGIFQKTVLSTNVPPMVFDKTLKSYHDDLCILSFVRGRYSAENLENLFSITVSGGYEDWEIGTLPLVIFEKIVPIEYKGKFSFVVEMQQADLSGLKQWDRDDYLERLKTYLINYAQIAEYELLKQSDCYWDGKDSRMWTAVIKMINLFFEYSGESNVAQLGDYLCTALQRAYNIVNFYDLDCQIPALFRDVFDQSIPDICKFQPMSNVMEVSEQNIQRTILYDTEKYYVPEALFSQICRPLNNLCTMNQVKDVLAREGILCTQGQGRIYRTIKKHIGPAHSPVRFVWLKRDILERDTMEMSFLDMYLIREGKHNAQ